MKSVFSQMYTKTFKKGKINRNELNSQNFLSVAIIFLLLLQRHILSVMST